MDGNIVSEVSQGKEFFTKIQRDIQQEVDQTIPVVSASIRNAGRGLASVSNNITKLIDNLNSDINRVYIPHLKIAQDNIDQYSLYRYVKEIIKEINCVTIIQLKKNIKDYLFKCKFFFNSYFILKSHKHNYILHNFDILKVSFVFYLDVGYSMRTRPTCDLNCFIFIS